MSARRDESNLDEDDLDRDDKDLDREIHRPALRAGGGGIERRRYELTPEEREIARRNRRWLKILTYPTLIIGGIGIALSLYASSRGPTVAPITVPAGYKSVPDGYYAYAVPKSWATNSLFSDYAGDLYNGNATAWAAESLGTRVAPIVAGETPPKSFESFGENVPTPYAIGPATPLSVKQATSAYRYLITRPGGFQAVAVDVWEAHTGAELWLLIHATPAVTDQILSTLEATES